MNSSDVAVGSSDPRGVEAALALLAWGLSLLATTVLVVTEVWLEPRPWVWPAVGAAYAGAAAAFLALVRRVPVDAGDLRQAPLREAPDGATLDADQAGGDGQDFRGLVVARAGGLSAFGEPIRARIKGEPLRAAGLVLALATAGGAVVMLHALGDGRPVREYWIVLAVWAAGVALYVAALADPRRLVAAGPSRAREIVRDVAVLVASALVLRLILLTEIPNVFTGDEGVFGNAAEWMSRGEGGHMFGTYWANATLYLVPHAALIKAIGPTILAVRLPGAVASAFAPAVTYAFGRAAFGRRVGLIAGALVVASHMHVHVSRMGLGHGLDALLAATVMWGLFRAFRARDVTAAVLAGVALGLAQLAYVGARMIDLVAIVVVVGLWLTAGAGAAMRGRSVLAAMRDAVPPAPLAAAVGASLVTAGPMIRWAIVRTDDYLSRVNIEGLVQSGRAEELLGDGQGPLHLALAQTREAALAFVGAPAVQFYFSTQPMLTVLWAALAVLGVVLAARRLRELRFLMPLAFVLVGGTVLALASNTSTSAYRITAAIPALACLAAVALSALVDAAHGVEASPRARSMTAGLVAGLIVGFELWAYFGSFAPGCAFWGRPSAITSAAGERVGPVGTYGAVFALTFPETNLGAFESVGYLTGRAVHPLATSEPLSAVSAPDAPAPERTIWDVDTGTSPEAIADRIDDGPHPVLVIAAPDRMSELDALRARYPSATTGVDMWCAESVLTWMVVSEE